MLEGGQKLEKARGLTYYFAILTHARPLPAGCSLPVAQRNLDINHAILIRLPDAASHTQQQS